MRGPDKCCFIIYRYVFHIVFVKFFCIDLYTPLSVGHVVDIFHFFMFSLINFAIIVVLCTPTKEMRTYELRHEISNNVVCAHIHSLIGAFASHYHIV